MLPASVNNSTTDSQLRHRRNIIAHVMPYEFIDRLCSGKTVPVEPCGAGSIVQIMP